MKISKKDKISEVVEKHPESAEVFMEEGMHCLGCAAAHFENIEEGCAAHGIDADKVVEKINKKISEKD
ncbi:DUF1858 domain-containing protein [Candidatus Woesearchaeota archaeon]|nr:DUF1858 domain-containing protein [Candidatus Woesearchaeota archaeon]